MAFADEVTAIWGSRGSGKTTLARRLLEDNAIPQAVIIDPISPQGCDTVGQVLSAIGAQRARIVFRNPAHLSILEVIRAAFLSSSRERPIFLVADEAPAYLHKRTDDLSAIMFQGRHRAFGFLILGQRPTAVDAQLRSQAARTYWMRLHDARDQAVAAEAIGRDRARRLAELEPGKFILHPKG